MLTQENLKKIEKIIEEFLEKGTFSAKAKVSFEDEAVLVDVHGTEELRMLVGEGGQILSEMQYLLKLIIRKKLATIGAPTLFYLNLDINDYKKKKEIYLRETARSAANEVILTRKEKVLPPMPAYERWVVHTELARMKDDVVSESVGKGADRKIVVSPHFKS